MLDIKAGKCYYGKSRGGFIYWKVFKDGTYILFDNFSITSASSYEIYTNQYSANAYACEDAEFITALEFNTKVREFKTNINKLIKQTTGI